MSLQFQPNFGHFICCQFCWCSCSEINKGTLCFVGNDNWFDITKNIKEAPSYIVNQHVLPFCLWSPYPYCKSSWVISDSTPVTNSVVYSDMLERVFLANSHNLPQFYRRVVPIHYCYHELGSASYLRPDHSHHCNGLWCFVSRLIDSLQEVRVYMGILLHAYIRPWGRRNKYELCCVCSKVRFLLICWGYHGFPVSIWQHRRFPLHHHPPRPRFDSILKSVTCPSHILCCRSDYLWGEILCKILSVDICGRCLWLKIQCFVSHFDRQAWFQTW